MKVQLHANATTTHKVRRMIQESDLPTSVLAKKYSLAVSTVRMWRNRDSVEDRSHTPHRLQTTLTPAQEAVVVEIRKLLLLPLDDLLAVTREFINPDVSKSGLDHCLRRHRVSRLKELLPRAETPKTVLPDNDKCFTDRFTSKGSREPAGKHVFDKLCQEQQIDH